MSPHLGALDIARALGQPPPTPEQRAVIEAPLESLLVVAGAGSGKTETMSARVVWLVANGLVPPQEILGLTFTRKAAGELAERIGRRLRELEAAGLWTAAADEPDLVPTVSTYHSYAGRIVSEHALRLGYEPGARLLSESSCWQLAHDVVSGYAGPLDQEGRDTSGKAPAESSVVDAVLTLSGQLAEHLRRPQELADHLDRVIDAWAGLPPGTTTKKALAPATSALVQLRRRRAVVPLLEAYQQAKRGLEALDFADQVSLAARIAARYPDVGAGERRRYRAVLLDEFQDTSEAQLALLRHLYVGPTATGPDPDCAVPVMAVGDPHQSIYGWRGASATTLTSFPQHFPTPAGPARTLPLSTSWRNDRAILAAANVVAAPLTAACPVPVARLAARPGAGPGEVQADRLPTVVEEAEHVAGWIGERLDRAVAAGEARPSAAVLLRKRSQLPRVVAALERRGLPVEVVGAGGLLMVPEVADLVSFLHVVDDPSRGDHLVNLFMGPMVRLGAADLAVLHDWARTLGAGDDEEQRVGLVEALDRLPPQGWAGRGGSGLSPAARERLTLLRSRVRRVRELLSASLPEAVGEAERVLGLDLEVLSRPRQTPGDARAHLEAFLDVAASYAGGAERPTLSAFLAWLEVAASRERGLDAGQVTPTPGAVQVLTVHASKGLEWDLVAVPGLDEGTFPSRRATARHDPDQGWVVAEPTDKAWLTGLDQLPYDLRGDSAGLPRLDWRGCTDLAQLADRIDRTETFPDGSRVRLGFVVESGEHQVEEERRLAYVAFTRARRELLLTAPVWGRQTTPRVTSPFLGEVRDAGVGTTTRWAPMPDAGTSNPLAEGDAGAAWPEEGPGDPRLERAAAAVRARRGQPDPGRRAAPATDPLEGAVSPAQTPAPDEASPQTPVPEEGVRWDRLDEEIEVLLAERARLATRHETAVVLPRHLSTSSLVAMADDPDGFLLGLRRPMPAPPATAARKGTLFHAWVEEHYGDAAMMDLDELPGSADPDELPEEDLEAMKAHFLASEWAERTPAEVELPVETTIAGVNVRGRIDAVFTRPGGGWTVVDWKTGARPSGRRARVREVQLAVYRVAYARLRGLDPAEVDAAFYYAASGETVRPTLPDETDLERLVVELLGAG